MRHTDIKVGMVLKLKAERQAAYCADHPFVIVTGVQERKGYAVPFIRGGAYSYKPSDFSGREKHLEWPKS